MELDTHGSLCLDKQHPSGPSDTVDRSDAPPNSRSVHRRARSKTGVLLLRAGWLRCLLLELPLLMVLFLYSVCTVLLSFHTTHFLPLAQVTSFFTNDRSDKEATYYYRACSVLDLTAISRDELIVDTNLSPNTAGAQKLTQHGVALFQNVLSNETASTLREFIVEKNKRKKSWYVIANENRSSWGIDVHMHPALQQAWREVASHEHLMAALQNLVGPDPGRFCKSDYFAVYNFWFIKSYEAIQPYFFDVVLFRPRHLLPSSFVGFCCRSAIIEFTAITASYGALQQFVHPDVQPDASAAVFARTFSSPYSLFIPLQDTTYEMGATHVCPGSHICSREDYCESRAVPLSDYNKVGPRGWGAVYNQQTYHRGGAHIDPSGPDRVILIMTFVPRPYRSSRGYDGRMISLGGTYSIAWYQWGHTLSDYVHADTRMTEPQRTLRSLGLIRGNGWNLLDTISMRLPNNDM
jgi:hypothetical protein